MTTKQHDLITSYINAVGEGRLGPVVSIEYLNFKNGRIASSLLVFERLHWPEVMAELVKREANT